MSQGVDIKHGLFMTLREAALSVALDMRRAARRLAGPGPTTCVGCVSSAEALIAADTALVQTPAAVITCTARVFRQAQFTGLHVAQTVEASYSLEGDEKKKGKKKRTSDLEPQVTVREVVADAADLILVGAFVGSRNCFPCAPNLDQGVSCALFHRGYRMSWPAYEGDVITLSFTVAPSALGRAPAPAGYRRTADRVVVIARASLTGELVDD